MDLVTLEPRHLPDLMLLKTAANWNQTEDDWLRCLRLQPDGCIGILHDGRIVACATTLAYANELSWIGMVLTLPEYRGQGLARKLMEKAIALSRGSTIKLDASDMGKRLYDSLGFIDECVIERWTRQPEQHAGPTLPPARASLSHDSEIAGADRSALLQELAKYDSAEAGDSYAFARPGSNWYYFGPWVSNRAEDAEILLRWFLGRHGGVPTCMDIFPHHKDAAAIATRYGFHPARTLTRMVLAPAEPQLPDPRIYGIAGFEFG